MLQQISGRRQRGEDLIFRDVKPQFPQPFQQVPLALLRCVRHKPNGDRSAAQPDGRRTKGNWPQNAIFTPVRPLETENGQDQASPALL